MFEVGQHQLLVLLLVVNPQQHVPGDFVESRCSCRAEEFAHLFIHEGAVLVHFRHRGPGQHTALGARPARSNGFVVRVEKDAELGMEREITGQVGGEKESLEEPGGVCQVPFQGAGVRHGLNDVVFRFQRLAQGFGPRANALIVGVQSRELCFGAIAAHAIHASIPWHC